ncbi:MAG TPA: haloacid dehalogenase-like hydrolase [Pyrinomonadaceae bacterium]|jgi:phosphoglycolate phosphatase-like HAD superfamily hydrolase|nr:haloacid dehalogenase-like hydrolase [Pyrinomonadaceae bacterium]
MTRHVEGRLTVAPEDLRVLLWDIDGTLLRSVRPGAFKDYVVPALESIFGTAGRIHEMRVSGMTDLQIMGEALRDHGITDAHVRARVAEIRTRFMIEMERVAATATADNPLFQLLPGARAILERVREHPRYRSTLLTGNLEPAAHLKLRLVGLSDLFQQLRGAFGDDSHDRRDLPAIAAARVSDQLKLTLRPAQFIVIGDTPNDIACAKHFGARSIAVCTGRFDSHATLAAHNPDALLPDLSDTELVLKTFDAL